MIKIQTNLVLKKDSIHVKASQAEAEGQSDDVSHSRILLMLA